MNITPHRTIGFMIILAAVQTTSYGGNGLKKLKTSN